ENSGFFPLTLALSPVENVSSWKINCGGRGDNRKKIHSAISDRVKYNTRKEAGLLVVNRFLPLA
ncbi:MAG TPA: hypothetical protein PLR25_24520, partial [Planctomycetaceae bacterium]|nr:hypothetical protein [Planctomycetaceae bacterium]